MATRVVSPCCMVLLLARCNIMDPVQRTTAKQACMPLNWSLHCAHRAELHAPFRMQRSISKHLSPSWAHAYVRAHGGVVLLDRLAGCRHHRHSHTEMQRKSYMGWLNNCKPPVCFYCCLMHHAIMSRDDKRNRGKRDSSDVSAFDRRERCKGSGVYKLPRTRHTAAAGIRHVGEAS
jgi:hypothetical protein